MNSALMLSHTVNIVFWPLIHIFHRSSILPSGICRWISAVLLRYRHRESAMSYEIGISTPDTPNRGFSLWICSVVMVILAGLFVFSRLAIRYYRGRLGWDDYTIFASLICSVILTITECSGRVYYIHFTCSTITDLSVLFQLCTMVMVNTFRIYRRKSK